MFFLLWGSLVILCTRDFDYSRADMGFIAFISVFRVVAIIFIFVGLKIIIRDIMVKIKGEKCFSKIIKVYATGADSDHCPVYNIDLATYIASSNKVEVLSKGIGTNTHMFPKGEYLKIQTYKGYLHLGKKIDRNQIPIYILNILDAVSEQNEISNSYTSIEDKYKIRDKVELYGEKQEIRIIRSIVSEYGISLQEATEALNDYFKNIHKSN